MKRVCSAIAVICLCVPIFAQDAPVVFQTDDGAVTADALGEFYYNRWTGLTEGENLAAGREFQFNLPCNWYICQKGNNGLELTDGELNTTEKYTIWFSEDVAAWTGTDRVNLWVDLGSVKPVERVVVRVQGRPLNAPRQADLYGSDDGESWRQIATLHQGAREQENAYYLPQQGAYVFPLNLPAGVKTRHVGMRLKLWSRHLVIDEIAVMKGADDLPDLAQSDAPEAFFHQSGIAPYFIRDTIPVTAEVGTQLYLHYNDPGVPEDSEVKIAWDLPAAVELKHDPDSPPETETVTHDGDEFTRYLLSPHPTRRRVGPVFPAASVTPGTELTSYLGARVDGEVQNLRPFTVQVIEYPNATPPQRLHTGLAWGSWFTYPVDPELHKRLGFNAVGCFPRYWGGGLDWWKNPERAADQLADIQIAHDADIDVIMNCGFLHQLKGEETRCQLPDGPAGFPCPSYRGEKYQELVDTMVGFYEHINPKWIFYDIELWSYRDPEKMKTCSRCQERFNGGDWDSFDEFLIDMGTEMMGDLYRAWEQKRQELGRGPFHVGSYNVDAADEGAYHNVWDFQKLYPDWLHFSMPSLYVGGRASAVANKIAACRKAQGTNDTIPWLTPGQDGEFPPDGQRDQVLEAFLNGSIGITYYWRGQMDPMELKVIAETIEMLRPFEDIIMDGEPIADELTCSTATAKVCGMANGDEALILVSVYDWGLPVEVEVSWLEHDAPVFDLDTGAAVGTCDGFEATVSGHRTKLYYTGVRAGIFAEANLAASPVR
ncbi:MAG: discoidin domain-containing protein [Armatimonadota bacterium]